MRLFCGCCRAGNVFLGFLRFQLPLPTRFFCCVWFRQRPLAFLSWYIQGSRVRCEKSGFRRRNRCWGQAPTVLWAAHRCERGGRIEEVFCDRGGGSLVDLKVITSGSRRGDLTACFFKTVGGRLVSEREPVLSTCGSSYPST